MFFFPLGENPEKLKVFCNRVGWCLPLRIAHPACFGMFSRAEARSCGLALGVTSVHAGMLFGVVSTSRQLRGAEALEDTVGGSVSQGEPLTGALTAQPPGPANPHLILG